MGIITDPGYELYIEDRFCFPAGKTPKKLYATFSGIKIGAAWQESWGQPLNGTYILEATVGDEWWTAEGLAVRAGFIIPPTHSLLRMWRFDGPLQFNAEKVGCAFEWPNVYQDPEACAFYGGFASVTMREQGDNVPSIKTVQNLVGVPPDRKTFAELSLSDGGKRFIRLARQKDGTCIKVKFQ